MASNNPNDEMWRAYLTGEHPALRRGRRMFRLVPSSPRCKVCNAPFHGPGGPVMRLMGRSPAHMNPRFCNVCEKMARTHPGGAELEVALIFADIRGSTPLAERLGTAAFSRLIGRFYETATDVLIQSDAWIDRLVGDEVVAMFLPGIMGADYAQRTVQAARNLLRATGHEDPDGPWVPIGIGIHAGVAFVGSVGSPNGVTDFTVLGDAPNLTARLASHAAAGEILLTEAMRVAAELDTGGLAARSLELKGKSETVEAWSLRIGVPASVS